MTSEGIEDIFVQKLDSDGNLIWAKSVGGADQDVGYHVITDPLGNVYVIGGFKQTVDFDPGPGTFYQTSQGALDIFVLKLDLNGNFQWAKSFGSSGTDIGRLLTLDYENNIIVIGSFYDTVDFDPGPGVYQIGSNGLSDAFIQKLDPSGNFLWAAGFGSSGYDLGYSIATDNTGNLLFGGAYVNTVDFDPGSGVRNLTSSGNRSGFLLKLNPGKDLLWARSLNATETVYGLSVSVDQTGNVYASGRFNGTVDLDPGSAEYSLVSVDEPDFFLQKLDAEGSFLWAKQIKNDPNSVLWPVSSVDGLGNFYTTAVFLGTADFDPGSSVFNLTNNDLAGLFIQKVDSNGNFQWAKNISANPTPHPRDIHTDAFGNIYIIGGFSETADFDPNQGNFTLAPLGRQDMYILKLASCQVTISYSAITSCDSYTTANGQHTWDSTGIYGYSIPNSMGCDSIITVDLTIPKNKDSEVDITACDIYVSPSGRQYLDYLRDLF